MVNNRNLAISLIGIVWFLQACSTRPAPAPVLEVYQGKTFQEVEKNSFSGNHYQVQKGDTLFAIAWQTGNDYRDLAAINQIAAPYKIYPGQNLRLTKLPIKSSQATGQTSKTNANQVVDRKKKQAYGESTAVVKPSKQSKARSAFPPEVKRWVWPAQGNIIGRFSRSESGNKGVGISNRSGSPILAAADGKVVYTGDALRGYGNLVIIKHTNSFLSAYAHNQEILVEEQQWINAGEKIATMGSSGTDKVMLHFEVRYKGKSVNPLSYLPKQ